MNTNPSLMQLMPVTHQFLLLSSMRNFSTKKRLFRPLNHLLYHYQQQRIPQPSRIVQIGVHQPPFHNNQALPLHFLLIININPNLIGVIVKHAVFKDTLPNDARCFDLSLINNPQHLILKALKDIASPHPGNHEPIMLFSTTTLLLLGCWIVEHLTTLHLT